MNTIKKLFYLFQSSPPPNVRTKEEYEEYFNEKNKVEQLKKLKKMKTQNLLEQEFKAMKDQATKEHFENTKKIVIKHQKLFKKLYEANHNLVYKLNSFIRQERDKIAKSKIDLLNVRLSFSEDDEAYIKKQIEYQTLKAECEKNISLAYDTIKKAKENFNNAKIRINENKNLELHNNNIEFKSRMNELSYKLYQTINNNKEKVLELTQNQYEND